MNQPDIKIEVRIHNVIFKCGMCDKFFNAEKTQGYAIGIVKTLEPSKTDPTLLGVPINILIICDKCYSDNKGKGLGFTEPSKIVIPTQRPVDINRIKEVIKNGQPDSRN